MGEQVRFPLSGAVSQWFNILENFNLGGQIGLINVELGDSSDPAFEHEVLDTVGSYGRQIGQLTDMIGVLLKLARGTTYADLDADDRLAIEKFEAQADLVKDLKRKRKLEKAGETTS